MKIRDVEGDVFYITSLNCRFMEYDDAKLTCGDEDNETGICSLNNCPLQQKARHIIWGHPPGDYCPDCGMYMAIDDDEKPYCPKCKEDENNG